MVKARTWCKEDAKGEEGVEEESKKESNAKGKGEKGNEKDKRSKGREEKMQRIDGIVTCSLRRKKLETVRKTFERNYIGRRENRGWKSKLAWKKEGTSRNLHLEALEGT